MNKTEEILLEWKSEWELVDKHKNLSNEELKKHLRIGDIIVLKNVNIDCWCESAKLSSSILSKYVIITKIPDDSGKFIHSKYYLSENYMKINIKNIDWTETLREWKLRKIPNLLER